MASAILALQQFWHGKWHYTCVQEWFEPFRHSNIVTGFGRIARLVLACPVKCYAEGSSYSGTNSCITLSARMARHSGMGMQLHYLSVRMVRAILARPVA